MHIFAITGSLRRSSLNTTLLRAAARLTPDGVTLTLYEGLGDLPPFNPDMEDVDLPAVRDFRADLRMADGVLISSPEYAHGVPGVLKNALDWVVGSGELIGKPIALISASPWATFAPAQLAETLTTMDARVIKIASGSVPLQGKALDESGIVTHPEIAPVLRTFLAALTQAMTETSREP